MNITTKLSFHKNFEELCEEFCVDGIESWQIRDKNVFNTNFQNLVHVQHAVKMIERGCFEEHTKAELQIRAIFQNLF